MAGRESWSEEALISACNAGDAAAFHELYLRNRDWAVRVAYRFTGDRDEALDVMQDAFAYLLSRFPGFTLSGRLTSFLYVVIRHGAFSTQRKLRRRTLTPDAGADLPAPPPGPDHQPPSEDTPLSRAVATLPDGQREVLLMRCVDGLSLAEIGTALSIPVGTVKSRLHHALAALRADPGTAAYFQTDAKGGMGEGR